MLVGTAALILVLSVFNGFEDLVVSLYDTFNPDLKITAKEGKVFAPDSIQWAEIQELEGVEALSYTLEENALIKYRDDNDFIARLKGVDDNYVEVSQVDTAIIDGDFALKNGQTNFAVLGVGVAGLLGVNVHNEFTALKIFMPRRDQAVSRTRPESAFTQALIYPVGVFAIQQDFDSKYTIVPLRFMRQLLNYENEVSGVELALAPTANVAEVQSQVQGILGEAFWVKDRYQQDEFLYKVMRTEKWAVYLILTFILIVAAFNMIGSLSMLVIEKKHDIGILKAMGASKQFIRRLFLTEGVLLSMIGGLSGMFIAFVICVLQQKFSLLKLQGQSFLIEAYPVSMRLGDFVLVFITVSIIAILSSLFPANRAAEQSQLLKEE